MNYLIFGLSLIIFYMVWKFVKSVFLRGWILSGKTYFTIMFVTFVFSIGIVQSILYLIGVEVESSPGISEDLNSSSLTQMVVDEKTNLNQGKKIEEQTFGFVEATSELKQEGYDFNPYQLVDGNPSTCWVEGVSGYGENEVITFRNHMYMPIDISEIHIINGYNAESPEMYHKNSRVKEIKIEFDDQTYYETLEDTNNVQVIKLDQKVSTGQVKITILSTYPGTTYDDTCLSEITFY